MPEVQKFNFGKFFFNEPLPVFGADMVCAGKVSMIQIIQ